MNTDFIVMLMLLIIQLGKYQLGYDVTADRLVFKKEITNAR